MPEVKSERRGAAAVLFYANAPKGTMTATGAGQLLEAFQSAAADPTVRVIVVTGGEPGMFIRHYDVEELVSYGDALKKAPPVQAGQGGGAFGALVDLAASCPKPVIAAINGLCMGGGFEFTLACDIRIAARSAELIGLPETRVGIFPGGGGTQRLPRVIGEAKALAFILEGAIVDAPRALELGLVHALAEDALTEALAWAERLAAKPAGGLAEAKRLVRSALDRPIAEGLAEERRAFAALVQNDPDAVAAMRGSLGRPIQRA
jgi:enoyl-CoA hydratase/carnithine racemase